MTSRTDPVSGLLGELAQVNGAGEAANGLIRVRVDGTCDLVDLIIEPKAMRLASEDLAVAIREAFAGARAAVQEQLTASPPGQVDTGEDAPDNVRTTLEELGSGAQRTLAELAATADALSRRLDQLA